MEILEDLEFRGLIQQITDAENLSRRLKKSPVVLYCGFDATGDSLQVGNLLPAICLKRFQLAGHKPIVLIGGGTSLIGDPSGKTSERNLNPQEKVEEWSEKIKAQLASILESDSPKNKVQILTNSAWLGNLKMIDFIRDVGKHFTLGYMLAKESVKSRLESGISFTEFSYMLFQAYDFLKLYQDFNCELQIGGSDQWGNITAGIDLIRKITGKEVFGLTLPLIMKSDGTKFGKTESGAIWLDPKKTSPYQFYQFWINTGDKDVIKFLKYFTFLSKEEILNLEKEVKKNPEKREAQGVLAREMTRLIHAEKSLSKAEKISRALFYGELKNLSKEEIEEGFQDVPSYIIEKQREIPLVELLVKSGASSSKRQAREDIKNGAISVNGEIYKETNKILTPKNCFYNEYLIICKGKKNYFLIRWQK